MREKDERRRMHFAVAAEYKRAPFCPRGVLRRPLLSPPSSYSLSPHTPPRTRIRCTHSLEAYTHAHTNARFSFPLASPRDSPSFPSLSLLRASLFAASLSLSLYVWTSRVRRKGCCALRVRNSRDIDKNKVHPHPHPRRASPIVGN